MTLEYIKTSQAESRARELERQGCDLIVARGVQARIIKQSVKLPVVEISVTLQELASVMLELKSELALPCPRIGSDRRCQYVQRHFPVQRAFRDRAEAVHGAPERGAG